MEGRLPRKLAAILYADVAGYSRLTGQDEDATHRRLSEYLDLISATVEDHRGRVMHYAGDAVLAMFDAVVDALSCSAHIQRELTIQNDDLPEDRRVRFRIGVNLGDVIEDRGDIYGDGVNVAARLESLAEPGGICVSEAVRSSVGTRLPLEFAFLGERQVKNIAEPVRAYRVRLTAGASLPDVELPEPRPTLGKRRISRRASVAIAGTIVAVFAGLLYWLAPWSDLDGLTSLDRAGAPSTDKPSVAVLPFTNLGDDPAKEYFGDGVTNDIITDLSKFSNLFVIASNSVFAYKGRSVNIQKVGRELKVRYVLEGSVQNLDDRIRVNAQLIDATSGHHLWADRYDENMSNLFDVQEQITKRIVRTLAVRITDIERDRAFARPTENLEAYHHVSRGRALVARLERGTNFEARRSFRQAIELDSEYAAAHSGLGWTYLYPVLYGWVDSPVAALNKAHELAQTAVALDEFSVDSYRLLGRVHLLRRQYDAALVELERAIALNPNDARSYADQGVALVWSSRPDGAIVALETALRFDPNMAPEALWNLGLAEYLKGRYKDAKTTLERSVAKNPDFVFSRIALAATYGRMGQLREAHREAAAIRKLDPFFDAGRFGQLFRDPEDAAHLVDGLRRAGLE
jgi:TolB-like protein/class 3 adenylate cyclase/Flp pilus assembly protein TadD